MLAGEEKYAMEAVVLPKGHRLGFAGDVVGVRVWNKSFVRSKAQCSHLCAGNKNTSMVGGGEEYMKGGFIHLSCNKHLYIQTYMPVTSWVLGGAQAIGPGPFLAGMDANMSMKAFCAVEDTLPPEVCLGCSESQGAD